MGRRLNRLTSRAIYEATRADLLPLYRGLVAQGYSEDEAVAWVTDEARDMLPGLEPSLNGLADALGDRLDEALSWRRVKNESFRAWLEDHDDLGPVLRLMFGFLIRLEMGGRYRPLR